MLVENKTNETLMITPMTTIEAQPRVIRQAFTPRQRDHRLKPKAAMILVYDMDDLPLAGIVVCRESGDCRVLENSREEMLSIENFDALPKADESWLTAIEETGLRNYAGMINIAFMLLSMLMFFLRWYIGKTQYNFG